MTTQHTERTRFVRLLTGIGALIAVVMAGCTSGGAGASQTGSSENASGSEPSGVAVEDLEAVPTIRLLTKTAADDPARFEQGRLIVEAWQDAGIPAELEPVDSAEIGRRGFAVKDFDVYLIAYDPTTDRLDPDNFLARFSSSTAQEDGSNLSGYTNSTYDELYDAQLSAATEEERRDAVLQMQQMLHEQQPGAPFLHVLMGGAYNSAEWTNFTQSVGTPVYHFWNSIGLTPNDSAQPLVIGITSEAQTLNPVTAATTEAGIPLSHIYDSLLRVDEEGALVNWAAQDVAVDGETITVTLRDGMTFHDGEAVTADDVAFSFDYLTQNESPLFAGRLGTVENVKADGNAVVITLASPNASFMTTALAQVPILPEHIWAQIDDPAAFANESPVGSGPFQFESRSLGAELRVSAFADHFSPPNAPGIVWATFGSLDAEIGALEAGEIDMLGDFVSLAQISNLEDAAGVTVLSEPSHGVNLLHYNMRREPFGDRHFRRALSHLIPVEDIIEVVFDGQGQPAASVIATPLWRDDSLGPFGYDPDRAREELEAAGYVFGDDGTLYFPPADNDNRVFDNDQ